VCRRCLLPNMLQQQGRPASGESHPAGPGPRSALAAPSTAPPPSPPGMPPGGSCHLPCGRPTGPAAASEEDEGQGMGSWHMAGPAAPGAWGPGRAAGRAAGRGGGAPPGGLVVGACDCNMQGLEVCTFKNAWPSRLLSVQVSSTSTTRGTAAAALLAARAGRWAGAAAAAGRVAAMSAAADLMSATARAAAAATRCAALSAAASMAATAE
jgi:hypothetical protein